jgi:hypothetical protein
MTGDLEAGRADTRRSESAAEQRGGERKIAPPTTEDEFRQYASDCRMMSLATNNSGWDSLPERWLRCAERPWGAAEKAGCGSDRMQPLRPRAPAAGAHIVAARGGGLIDLLLIRMEALDLHAGEIARVAPAAFGELADACVCCDCKERCERDLAYASAQLGTPDWQHYCPNAATLTAIGALPWFATTKSEDR